MVIEQFSQIISVGCIRNVAAQAGEQIRGFAVCGTQTQHFAETLNRLLATPQLFEQNCETDPRLDIFRIQLQGLLKTFHGLIEFALLMQSEPEVSVNAVVPRCNSQHLPIRLNRPSEVPGLKPRNCKLVT